MSELKLYYEYPIPLAGVYNVVGDWTGLDGTENFIVQEDVDSGLEMYAGVRLWSLNDSITIEKIELMSGGENNE